MSQPHLFEHDYMRFSIGGVDEKLAYDRYSTPEHDIEKINVGDTVICKLDRKTDKRIVGTLTNKDDLDKVIVKTRELFEGIIIENEEEFHHELITKPLDLFPHQFWDRWAKAGASVEKSEKQFEIENMYRDLMDGFDFSAGGRIQLGAGQEFVTGNKAHLTMFNCFVIPNPDYKVEDWDKASSDKEYALKALLSVVENATNQVQILARGGGMGNNFSTVPPLILGANSKPEDVYLYLPKEHIDTEILEEMKMLGKFDHVVVGDILPKSILYKRFVVEDSREGLMEGIKFMVNQLYHGGKVILDFSNIRYKGALVKGVNGRSSGAPSWMALYNVTAGLLHKPFYDAVDTMEIETTVTQLMEQGGSRRGALMIVLNCNHLNILKFITRKQTEGYLVGANISVGVTDEFMQNAWVEGTNEEAIWNMIIESAHKSAEPGVLFMTHANNESNSYYFAPLIATNPCGEQFLPAWGVCNLGHWVLSRYYDSKVNDVDWNKLARKIRAGVRFQDAMIDYTEYFNEENKEQQLKERRVGLGTMGLATLLIKLGIRYGSDESIEFIDKLYKFIAVETNKAEIDLAEEKGAFPACDPVKMSQSEFMKRLLPELPKEYQNKFFVVGVRNVTSTTQAPTGSTGTEIDNLLMQYNDGTSTGVEPYFAEEYFRASRSGKTFMQKVRLFEKWREEHPNQELPDYYTTAQDLTAEEHIRVQAAIQKWTDSSISKTANAPASFTVEDTRKLYDLAYKLGCKGVTVYVDGSRSAQVLSTDKNKAKLETDIEEEKVNKMKLEKNNMEAEIQKRPTRLYGFTEKIKVPFGDSIVKAYVTINVDAEGNPAEVFVTSNTAEFEQLASTVGRLTTQFLRYGSTKDNLDQVAKHLRKGQTLSTFSSKLASLLEQVAYGKIQVPVVVKNEKKYSLQKCSSCGEDAYDKGNCICHACGTSKCN